MPTIVGPSPYIYVCTRVRVRKTKLIPREEYLRMLNMSLSEITRVIQESEYKKEIDELSHAFKGINLVEIALSWNLAKTYQGLIAIAPGHLQEMTKSYLRSWDIQNVIAILRGKSQGLSAGRIKEVLIPAGELDRAALDRILAEDKIEKVIESLKGSRLYPILIREYPRAVELGSFAHLENELYKQYYADIISDGQTVKGGKAFLDYIHLEIDIRNMQNLLRLRSQEEKGDVLEYMIHGGSFTTDQLVNFSKIEDMNQFIDTIEAALRNRQIVKVFEDFRERMTRKERDHHESEIALTRLQLAQILWMSKLHPFSIWPILAFLELKKYEIFNLRAITRGKEANLPMERIRKYLVM
ncbi:MAG: V-type ATP synthase subunit C [Methanomicrobiales archaeon]|nr:V-type ATP synthase subunit C [Methanomicrobiales archaeon]